MDERLFLVARYGSAGVIGLTSGEMYVAPAEYPTKRNINCVAFSSTGSLLAIGLQEAPYLVVFDTATWATVTLPTLTAPVLCCAFHPDGTQLCAGYYGTNAGFVRLNTATWGLMATLQYSNLTNVSGCAYAPDGSKLFVTYGATGYCRGWTLSTGNYIAASPNPGGAGKCCAFSPDGTKFAIGYTGGVKVYEAMGLTQVALSDAEYDVSGLAFSPDGEKLAVVGTTPSVQLINTSTWETQILPIGFSASPRSCAFTPDGAKLLVPIYSAGNTVVHRFIVADASMDGSFAVPGAAASGGAGCAVSPMTVSDLRVSGVVSDDTVAPTSRLVRLYDRDSGALTTQAFSDPSTGIFSFGPFLSSKEMQRIVLDDESGVLHNDIIDRVIPG